MGWFDQEQGKKKPSAAPQPSTPRQRSTEDREKAPSTSQAGGSSLGSNVHVDGTIRSEEDLTILGKVTGDIRAKRTLMISKEADVQGRIDGQRVLVHGKVEGDIYGAEKVVLGATARLEGNIEAPALEINEGAFFRGQVDMEREEPKGKDVEKRPSKKAESRTEKKEESEQAAAQEGRSKKPASGGDDQESSAAAAEGNATSSGKGSSSDETSPSGGPVATGKGAVSGKGGKSGSTTSKDA